jgi:hypothetical protein
LPSSLRQRDPGSSGFHRVEESPAVDGQCNLRHGVLPFVDRAIFARDQTAVNRRRPASTAFGRHGIEAGEVIERYGAEGIGPPLYLTDSDDNVVELKGRSAPGRQCR